MKKLIKDKVLADGEVTGHRCRVLTPEQAQLFEDKMVEWRDYASAPSNHKDEDAAINAIYKEMGKKAPTILHFTSPVLAVAAASLFSDKKNLSDQLSDQLNRQLGDQLDNQLYDQLGDQLYDQLYDQLSGQLRDQLNRQLGDQLDNQLYAQLNNQLDSQLRSQIYSQLDIQLGNQLRNQLYSKLDSNFIPIWWGIWGCYYDWADKIGVRFNPDTLSTFVEFVKNIHSILPYDGLAIVSDKPARVSWRGNQLHNDTEKAVEYADGWGWHALYGVPEAGTTP